MVLCLNCQNGADMSKLCRYILSKWCAGLEYFGLHHNLHHTTNASLMIEHSKQAYNQAKQGLAIGNIRPCFIPKRWHKSCKLALLALPDAFIRSLAAYIQSA